MYKRKKIYYTPTPLHLAIKTNQEDTVRKLIQKKDNIHQRDLLGRTPLYIAAQHNKIEIANILLENGAHPDSTDNIGASPLYLAIQRNNLEMIQLLLSFQANLSVRDQFPILLEGDQSSIWGKTILHWAIYFGNLEIVTLLLKYRPDIEAMDYHCWRPLHEAALKGSSDLFDLLLQHGANIDALGTKNFHVLHIISEKENPVLLKKCLAHPIHAKAIDNHRWNALHHYAAGESTSDQIVTLLCDAGLNLDAPDFQGSTPLHIACKYSNKQAITYLLAQGANIHALDNIGRGVFSYATTTGSLEIINVLFLTQPDRSKHHEDYKIALRIAAQNNYIEIFDLLLEALQLTDLLEIDQNGWNVMHYACMYIPSGQNQSFPILERLIKGGISLEHKTREGSTALHIAVTHNNFYAVKYLLAQGADIYACDSSHLTPFQIAIANNTLQMIELLYKTAHDAPKLLDHKNNSGSTALHIAVTHNNAFAVKYLLAKNANIYARDKNHFTPFQIAVLNNALQIMELLYRQNTQKGKVSNQQFINDQHENSEHENSPTALLIAAQFGDEKTINWLLAKEANPHSVDNLGDTVIHYAASRNHPKIISLFRKKGVDIHQANQEGLIPLQIAAQCNNYPALLFLLKKTQYQRTIAYDAASHMTPSNMEELLLQYKVPLDNINHLGNTTLHEAASHSNLATSEWLMSRYPHLCSIKNQIGETPLELAIRTQNTSYPNTPYDNKSAFVIALLWVQKQRDRDTKPNPKKDAVIQSIQLAHQEKIILNIQAIQKNYLIKKNIRRKLYGSNNTSSPFSPLFYSEEAEIEVAARLKPSEIYSLLFLLEQKERFKNLPLDLCVLITDTLLDSIKKDSKNRNRMESYPSIIDNKISPYHMTHTLCTAREYYIESSPQTS